MSGPVYISIAAGLGLWGALAASAPSTTGTGNRSKLISELRFSSEHSGPSIVQADEDGSVWVALARASKVARVRNNEIREFNLPAGSFPVGIARAKGNYLYVSDIRRNVIVQLDTASGATRDFAIPTQNAWPFFLGMTSDGHVWFSERVGNKIGSLDPVSSAVKEYAVPTEQAQPAGLTVTPDDHIYFTENTGHKIGHIDPKIGRVVELATPSQLRNSPFYGLAGIATDGGGNVWFSELDGRLCRIDRKPGHSDKIVEIALPDASVRPAGVAIDRWGIVWFTELDGNAISSYNPALGAFDKFPIPTGSPDPSPMGPPEATARGEMPTVGFRARTSRPFGIAVDTVGRIWFSEQYAHQLGRLDVPELRLYGPTGRVVSATAPILLEVRSPNAPANLKYELNGVQIPAAKIVDLTSSPGGANQLRVSMDHDGRTADASTAFVFDPDMETIRRSVAKQAASGLLPESLASGSLKRADDAVKAAKAGETEKARQIEQDLIRSLTPNAPVSKGAEVLLSQIQWKDRFGKHDHVVNLADSAKSQVPLVVEAGDMVEWKASAASKGAMQIGPCDSAAEFVRYSGAGGTRFVFHKPGTFAYALNGSSTCAGKIVVVPRRLFIEEFPLPNKDSVPGVLSVDLEGNVWFTEGGGGYSKLAGVPLNNRIGCLRTDGTIKEYSTPSAESAPTSIHVGKEGHVWFTERAGNNLGELFPDTGKIVEYPVPTPNSGMTGITVDHDGKIWFASKGTSKIGYLDPVSKKAVEFDTPTPKSQPSTITVDDDNNVWFDERASDKIVRLDVRTNKMKEFSVPTKGSRVVGLVPDHKGNVWFLELGANKVGHLTVATGTFQEYSIPTAFSSPFKEALDNDGRLWFTEVFGNKVGVLDNGVFTEYQIPTEESMPGGITIDARGNIWFSEQAGNKIARIPAWRSAAPAATASVGGATSLR